MFTSASDVVRWTFSPLVYLLVASIINELARQSRSQLHSIHALADEKERMLQRTFDYASQLEESEAKYRAADRMGMTLAWTPLTSNRPRTIPSSAARMARHSPRFQLSAGATANA